MASSSPMGAYKIPYSLADWLKQMQRNPHVYARVMTAKSWLDRQFSPTPENLLSELVCYDFSHAVSVVPLEVGTTLVGYKPPACQPIVGTLLRARRHAAVPLGHRAGKRSTRAVCPWPRSSTATASRCASPKSLKSTCAPARDTWSRPDLPRGQLMGGGATQYVIPNAAAHLVKVP